MKKILVGITLLSTTILAEQPQTIGIAASYTNSMYQSKGQFIPIPLINLHYKDLYLKGVKVGYTLYKEDNFQFGAIINPLGGYFDGWTIKSKDMKNGYKNIKDRKSQFMYGVETSYMFDENVMGNISYLWGSKGSTGKAELTYIKELNDRLIIMPSINFKYYNKKYLNYYIGVSKDEVTKNEKISKEYKTNDSFTAGVNLTVEYRITEQTTASIFGGYDYFDKKIKNSPIVNKKGQVYGGIGIRYSF